MKRKVAKVFKALNKRGMTQAFIEIEKKEFIFPAIIEKKKVVKKGYIFWLGITVFLTGGIMLLNKLWYTNTTVLSDKREIVNQTDHFGMSPLHHAVIQLDQKRIEMLIKLGAQINIQDSYGWTPLHWAIFKQNEKICGYLINSGALITVKTRKKWFKYPAEITPVEMARLVDNKAIFSRFKSIQMEKKK